VGDHQRNNFDQSTNFVPRRVYISISYCLIGIFLTVASLTILIRSSYNFSILLLVFTLLFGLFVTIATLKRINPIVTIFLIGLGLALLSFAYQSFGPERRMFGTECQPIRDCFRPVLGGGFPVQYVIDVPGITYQNILSFEDDFRVWPFIADVCFYICLMSLIYRVIGVIYIRIRKPKLGRANQSLEP
jgi:hypothetical protein